MPTRVEVMSMNMKFPATLRAATISKLKVPRFSTDLNRAIATASFIRPSPKTMENILSCCYPISVRAATESDAQIVAENSRILVGLRVSAWRACWESVENLTMRSQ